jgi:hypothetical protein
MDFGQMVERILSSKIDEQRHNDRIAALGDRKASHDNLKNNLNHRLKKMLNKFDMDNARVEKLSNQIAYEDGFKAGVKIVIDALIKK